MVILVVSLLETMLEVQELPTCNITGKLLFWCENKPPTLLRENGHTLMMVIDFFMFVLF